MCDYGHRFIAQLDSQRSIPDAKGGNTNDQHPTSTGWTTVWTTFGPQFLIVQTQTFTGENFCLPQASAPIQVLNF